MAEVPRNRLPSGHEEDFEDPVDEDFFCCSICQLTMREPVQTICGHRYCKECLQEHLRRQDDAGQPRTCPVDREGLPSEMDFFLDKFTDRKILSFMIKCPLKKDGCEWRGELRNKGTHLASCPWKDVPCTNPDCPFTVKRKDLSEHVSVTCQWRIIQCEHCSEPHPKCQMENHLREQCKLFPLPCPFKCGTLILRDMIDNHTRNDCPQTIISCPYALLGCNIKILRKQTDSHLQSSMRFHLDLVCAKLQSTQEEQDKLKKTTIELQEKVDMLKTQLVEVNTNYSTLQKKTDSDRKRVEEKANHDLKEVSNKLKTIHTRLEEKLNIVQEQLKENQRTMEEELARRENIGFKQQEEMFDAFQRAMEKVNLLEARLKNKIEKEDATKPPQYTWKIPRFKDLFLEAKKGRNNKIDSARFYTAPYGYKLKLYINPNGQGLGESSHLSVYLTVVRGEYDAVLPWPFHKKIIFTLIDQQDRRKNIVKYLFADPKLKNFSKPVADENPGRGFCRFIAHKELTMERFARDGNLYIQVHICPPS